MDFKQKERYNIYDLVEIIRILRGENGCPWDREQDHKSIRKNFIEETYEVIEAIDTDDKELLKEELGDVLMQVVFHSAMEEEINSFNFDDVANGVCQKLINRHPHVFSDVEVNNSEEVLKNWEKIKQKEKKQTKVYQTLQQVSKSLPALMRAEKVQQRAKRVGFDFKDANQCLQKLNEEIEEFKEVMHSDKLDNIHEELGDILFTFVNIARFFGGDSEKLLTNSIEKFITRFSKVEELALKNSASIEDVDLETLDSLWNQVKKY